MSDITHVPLQAVSMNISSKKKRGAEISSNIYRKYKSNPELPFKSRTIYLLTLITTSVLKRV